MENGIFSFLLTKLDNGEPNSQPLRLGPSRGVWGAASRMKKKNKIKKQEEEQNPIQVFSLKYQTERRPVHRPEDACRGGSSPKRKKNRVRLI